MFLSRDSWQIDASSSVKGFDKVPQNLVTQTRQLKYTNLQLADKIPECQRMEETLPPAEEKYRSIFDNAVEGIFQITPDGRYLLANPALARIYGYESPAQLVTLSDINRQYVDPHRHQEFIQQFQEQDQVSGFESQVYRQDGSTTWISESARAVRDERGVLVYCEGFVREIAERELAETTLWEAKFKQQSEQLELVLHRLQQAESQLIQSEKMSSLGQMVAGVAHEINNPVSFVCGNLVHAGRYAEDLINLLQLYQKHYPQPVPAIKKEVEAIDLNFLMLDFPKALSSMQMGADRIRQIVLCLRNFSRLDEGKMKPVNLHEGIDTTLVILNNRLKATPKYQGITVVKEYGDLPLVECYGGLLNQVFMNIFSNAIDALEQQANRVAQARRMACLEQASTGIRLRGDPPSQNQQIRIRTQVIDNEWVVIRIADSGPGMPEDVKARIFDPFFTTKPMGQGTGLGLSISHQIVVERHGGKLKCFSAPDRGTEFVIEIPIRR